jgi:hypothetical protein
MIVARANMLGHDKGVATWPSMREQPWSDLRAQLERISKSEEISNEVLPGLESLFTLSHIRVVRTAGNSEALRSQLQSLRSQLQLYKLQHMDNYPNLKTFGWSQLTQRTTASGNIADGALPRNHATFGPYLSALPHNPFTGSSKVHVVNSTADLKPNKSYGFVFEESTGRIYGVVADGSLFNEDRSADVR